MSPGLAAHPVHPLHTGKDGRWDQGGNPVGEACVGLGKGFAGDN